MHSSQRMLEWGGILGDTGICRICRIAWKGWKVMNDWNVRNVFGVSGKTGKTWNVSGAIGVTGVAFVRTCGWNAWNVTGRSCKTHGCISRRSPCLLCVEFLETGLKVSLPSVCSSSTRRALCLLHVELDFWMENSLDVHV